MTDRPSSVGRASALLASGTFVSRALGFVSAAALAWAIGQQNQGANAFAIANQLPNNIYAIVAGGLLSAILVPQIVRAAHHEDGGQRFVNRLVTLGITLFLGITLIATLCAPFLVWLYAAEGRALSEQGIALAVSFAYWCLPQVFFYAVYSLLGEILNARGVFGPFTWAPVLNNVVVITTLVLFVTLFGPDPAHQDPSSWGDAKITLLAGGATLGVAAQAIVLLVFWRRTGLGFRPDFRWRGVGLGATGRAAGWTFGMILVTQLAGIVQSRVATLAGEDDPSVMVLRTTWLIFMLPHSIIAVSIATPFFTRMSHHARDGDHDSLRADLSSSLRTIGLLITGAAAALLAAAIPFAAFFANSQQEVVGISTVLTAYLIGLVPFSVLFLLQRGFYALGDTRTPFFLQLVQSGLFVIGALGCALLPPQFIAVGIAAVTSVAGTAQAIAALLVLRRRLGGLDGRRLVRRYAVYLLAALPALAAGYGVLALLGGFARGGFSTSGPAAELISVAAVGTASLIVYLLVVAAFRVPELRELAAPVARVARRR
jgi:putative peptidoglycan lipid II flippase